MAAQCSGCRPPLDRAAPCQPERASATEGQTLYTKGSIGMHARIDGWVCGLSAGWKTRPGWQRHPPTAVSDSGSEERDLCWAPGHEEHQDPVLEQCQPKTKAKAAKHQSSAPQGSPTPAAPQGAGPAGFQRMPFSCASAWPTRILVLAREVIAGAARGSRRLLDELATADFVADDGLQLAPAEVHSYLQRVLYNRRNKCARPFPGRRSPATAHPKP